MFQTLTSPYLLVVYWIGIVALISGGGKFTRAESVIGSEDEVVRTSKVFAFVVFLPLLYIAATRDMGYFDSSAYRDKFLAMPVGVDQISAYLEKYPKDKGFSALSIIIKTFLTKDYQVYFFIIAAIQGLCLISVYRKYSPYYVFSIALFVLSTDYVAWMHNGIRQFTAACIVFACTTLLLKRKMILAIALIYLASFFHQSALIALPLVIIVQGKAWNKMTLLFILLSILAIVFVSDFTNLLDSSLTETQYSNVVSDYTELGKGGTNPLRVLMYSMPAIIAFFGRNQIHTADNRLLNMCVNASLLTTGLYIVSMFTSGMYLGRLPIYMSLYNYILLPWEIDHIFVEAYRGTVRKIAIFIYGVFFYYQMSITWGLF